MNESFRLRRSILVQGVLSTLVCLAATVGSTSVAFIDEPAKHGFEREHSVAIVVGMGLVVFGGMTLLSLYMLRAYYVEHVAVVGTAVSVTTVFQKRDFDAAAVDKLTWKLQPVGGKIDFCVSNRRTKVELSGYSEEDRLRMIRLFRALIPEEKQVDWRLFCQKIALPLRDRCSLSPGGKLASPASAGEVVITRARYDRMAAVLLPASLVPAVAYWWTTGAPVSLVLPAFVGFLWLFLRYSIRREGESRPSLIAVPGGRTALFGVVAVFCAPISFAVLLLAGLSTDTARTVELLILAPALLLFIYGSYRMGKQRGRDAEIAATTALDRWNRNELAAQQLP